MKDKFNSIAEPGEGFLKEKGSKFLAFAHPCDTLSEIEALLEQYRKRFYDSRHVCFAYRLGPEGKEWRASDAGEPSHSAGDPIYNEIRSWEITNVLVIVVRYFGGTKLGIPGLIDAYKRACRYALENTTVKEITITEAVFIRYPYEMTSAVNRVMHHHKLKPADSQYGADCQQKFHIRKGLVQEIQNVFREIGILENDNQSGHEEV